MLAQGKGRYAPPGHSKKMLLPGRSYKSLGGKKAETHWRAPPRGCPVRNRGEGPGKLGTGTRAATRPAPSNDRLLENSSRVVSQNPQRPLSRVAGYCNPDSATAHDRTFREKDELEYNPLAGFERMGEFCSKKRTKGRKPDALKVTVQQRSALFRGLRGVNQIDIHSLVAHVRGDVGSHVPVKP